MQRLIWNSRMVVAIWPAGRRAKEAALHLAASAASAAEGAGGGGIMKAEAGTTAVATTAQASKQRRSVMSALESVMLIAG
jgi:hypothetical protein